MQVRSIISRLAQFINSKFNYLINSFIIFRFHRNDKVIYLTFDDGPIENITEGIVNTLKDLRVTAGFFFNGSDVIHHQGLVKKIHSLGFFIGNHSYNHYKYKWSQWSQELNSVIEGNEVIESITRNRCKVYRPPYGKITPFTFFSLKIKKYKIIYWNVDSRDFEANDISEIKENIRKVKSGDIILFHSDCSLTAKSLHNVVSELADNGFRFGDLTTVFK